MNMPGRSYSSGEGYRFGFNGKETDKEYGAGGGTQDYGFRMYSPAVGKFLSTDPLFKSYPWYTPYQFAGNAPIKFIDLDGLETFDPAAIPTGITRLGDAITSRYIVNWESGVSAGSYTMFGATGENGSKFWVATSYKYGYRNDYIVGPESFGEFYKNSEEYFKSENLNRFVENLAGGNDNMIDGWKSTWNPTNILFGMSMIGKAVISMPYPVMTETNTTVGWRLGDPINNLTSKGNVPKWSTVRTRYWKNRAYYAQEGEFSTKNLARMKKGRAPQRYNEQTGKMESMELDHTPPQREGGLFDFQEVWPDEHAAQDPYRHTGKNN